MALVSSPNVQARSNTSSDDNSDNNNSTEKVEATSASTAKQESNETEQPQTLLEGKDISNPNARSIMVDKKEEDNEEEVEVKENNNIHIDSLQEAYNKFTKNADNENLEYDADGAVKFIRDFATQASIIEQKQYISTLSQNEELQPKDITSDKLFTLLASDTRDLADNFPQPDGKVHLLASPETGTVIPDPYIYANSAETLGADTYKITISEKDARIHADKISVWTEPSNANQSNYDAFLDKTSDLNVNTEKLSESEQDFRIVTTASASNHLLGEASLYSDSYGGKDHFTLRVNLNSPNKNDISEYNNMLNLTTVGIYQSTDDPTKQHLQLYPIVEKPATDVNGKELKFIGYTTFEKNRVQEERFTLYSPSINPQKDKTICITNTNCYIAGVKLDDADKQNLKTLGVTDHSISLTSPSGKTHDFLISAVPDTKFDYLLKISAYDPSSLKINEQKQKEMGISDTQIQQMKEGNSVECKVNGSTKYLMINPASGNVTALNQKPDFADRNGFKQEIKEENAAEKQAPYKDYSQNNDNDNTNHGHKL